MYNQYGTFYTIIQLYTLPGFWCRRIWLRNTSLLAFSAWDFFSLLFALKRTEQKGEAISSSWSQSWQGYAITFFFFINVTDAVLEFQNEVGEDQDQDGDGDDENEELFDAVLEKRLHVMESTDEDKDKNANNEILQ